MLANTIHRVSRRQERSGTTVAKQVLISAPISWAAGSFRFTEAVGKLQPKEWLRCLIGAMLGVVGAFAILGIGFVFMEMLLALFPSATRWAPTVGLASSALLAVLISIDYDFRLYLRDRLTLFGLALK